MFRLKESLSEAYRDSRRGASIDRTALLYKNTLRQSISDLHNLGYSILSFYVDYHLSSRLSNHQHNTLVNTIHKLQYTTGRFTHSCSLDTAHKQNVSLCGSVHLHNLQNINTLKFTKHVYTMQVPHMFYIHLHMLEVILLGGLSPLECKVYQYLTMCYWLTLPFSLNQFSMATRFLICGTRQPFSTVVPGNTASVHSRVNVNAYASFKLRYSAMDLQVSLEPLRRR